MVAALGTLMLLGLASPFLEFSGNPVGALIGLVILFVGMRFAWHVLIREKHGKVTFVAAFADGRRLEVPPHDYLTSRQDREMSGQPDLILQLAHQIGRDLAARGLRGFAIHAITAVSLNGRAPAAMIDPGIDLLTVRDLGARSWVLPAPKAPPPRVIPPR